MKHRIKKWSFLLLSCIMVINMVPITTAAAEESEGVKINGTNFPDSNFMVHIQRYDTNYDGILSDEEISVVKSINAYGLNISSFKGIEYFTSLNEFACYNQKNLKELDLSQNTALEYLDCSSNCLTTLDLSHNTALKTLNCSSNDLTTLNLNNCTNLEKIDCSSNDLAILDINDNIVLSELICQRNVLTSLDTSNNSALSELLCNFNKLTELDCSKNTGLKRLWCDYNKLTMLNVDNCINLNNLACDNNELTHLSLDNNPALAKLYLYNNKLTTLDLSNNPALDYLNCSENNLTMLDTTQNPALTFFNCSNNSLKSLDVHNNVLLETLECGGNQITTLDVGKNTALTKLKCDSNQLTALDISKNVLLNELACNDNQLTTLDISHNLNLKRLECNNNNIPLLDIQKHEKLWFLNCAGNQLASLDTGNNTRLKTLDCSNNNLVELDIKKNKDLKELYCSDNSLRKLYFDNNGNNDNLQTLYCAGNQLTSLYLMYTGISRSSFRGDRNSQYEIDYNRYMITPGPNRTFNLSSLPDGFDISKASDWEGGTVKDNILTIDDNVSAVTYKYECYYPNKYYMTVELMVDTSGKTPLMFHNKLSIETSYVGRPMITYFKSDAVEGGTPPYTFQKILGPDWISVSSDGIISGTPETTGVNSNLTVRVTDAEGSYREVVMAVADTKILVEGIEIDASRFPDENFRSYVLQKDTDGDGKLSKDEISAVQTINVNNCGISNLKGIECFTALKTLNCSGNNLTDIDVHKNTDLQALDCSDNQLATLDISGNSKLSELYCSNNRFASLDVSSNAALEKLYCHANQLTALDTSSNPLLKILYCGDNQLTVLDVSKNPALMVLYCSGNQLTSLDLGDAISAFYGDTDEEGLNHYNQYRITPNADYTFDPRTLPGNFDLSRTSDWNGASVNGDSLVIEQDAKEVSYTYDCGSNKKMTVKLLVNPPAVVPLTFKNNTGFTIKSSVVNTAIPSYSVADSVSGGMKPYTFSKTSGPDWITVSPAGMVSGTPVAAGKNGTLVIRVTDKNKNYREISIDVADTEPLPRTEISSVEATTEADITPVYNGTCTIPSFAVEKGSPAVLDSMEWQKKSGGGGWDTFTDDTFTEGTWRLYGRVYLESPELSLSDSLKIKINGTDWVIDGMVSRTDTASYAWIYSPEFTVEQGVTPPGPTPPELPYVDVAESDWFYDAVAYNYAAKTMTGLDDTHFAPTGTLVRAQFAAVLHKMNQTPEMPYTSLFSDVLENDWFKNAVLWAKSKNIVNGYTDTDLFGPNDNVTRAQMATMMYRYAKDYKEYDIKADGDYSEFPDAGDVQEFAIEAMKWAVSEEIITGKTINGQLLLDPQGSANRAECATIIQRFMEKYK